MEKKQSLAKADRWFDREHLKTDLKKKSIKGGVSTISAQAVMFILNMGSTVVLARLLMPADYGLVALVTAVTGFVLLFKDMGLAQAILQNKDLNHDSANKVFWLNLLISGIIAILIVAIAPLLVYFYDEPRVLGITMSFGLVALFSGLTMQHSSLMRRQMMFRTVSRINIAAAFVGVSTGILLGYLGFGYWAIVAINVANYSVTMILSWVFCDWRPNKPKIDGSIMELVKFGMDVTGFNLINYFARNLDNVMIGKYVGTAQLGLYSKAYQLLMLPITQIRNPLMNVGIPAMSSLVDNDSKFREYFRKYVYLISFFSMPVVAFLAVSSFPLVAIILGPNWLEVPELFTLLAIMAFLQPASSACGLVLIAQGQTRRYLYYGLINAVIMVISFIIGIQWGVKGLIIGGTIGYYVFLIPAMLYSLKKTPVGIIDFFSQVAFPALFSILAVAVTVYAGTLVSFDSHLVTLIVNGLVFTSAFLIGWLILPQSRKKLMEVISIAKAVFNK